VKIGELAQKAGCKVETVRYYELQGLLPEPGRSAGNYRQYDAGHLERLRFIRNCRSLEMSLAEIAELLGLRDCTGQDCARVNDILAEHIGHVSQRIAQLRDLRAQLTALHRRCQENQAVEHCAILAGLAAPRPGPDKPPHVPGAHS